MRESATTSTYSIFIVEKRLFVQQKYFLVQMKHYKYKLKLASHILGWFQANFLPLLQIFKYRSRCLGCNYLSISQFLNPKHLNKIDKYLYIFMPMNDNIYILKQVNHEIMNYILVCKCLFFLDWTSHRHTKINYSWRTKTNIGNRVCHPRPFIYTYQLI